MHIVTEIDRSSGALYATNAYNVEFAGRTAFFQVDDPTRTVSANRTEFLGRNGTLANPAAMRRAQLSNKVGAGLDPCGALQVVFDLADGGEREIVFTLGTTGSERVAPRRALEKVQQYWERTLGAVQVETPERSFDLMSNGWLVYQTLACRLWARSGHYQSGGAFGFRDQLQDVIALLHAEPRLARSHLLACAAHQFGEGDVQHWWHPPSGRGVRTHCSDDYLWLAWAASRYVLATGDAAVLQEPVHFLEGRPVNPEDDSYYDLPARSAESASLYQHCVRAIERGLRFGERGLPLMGSGDWNDGMDQVGAKGKGESVWLGFFLFDVLMRFSALARAQDDMAFAQRCVSEAARLRASLEEHGWDGAWYRRAYFDDGTPLGSAANAECRIDSIAQSWSVLSGAGGAQRSREAMHALDRHLVRRSHALVQLLDPPFDQGSSNPGYIKGYVPGVRENGGQYTHAAIWAAMAFAQLGDERRAWELFGMINPVNHTSSAAALATYKVEPYVMAADVYAAAPHTGRGGWTWYTGSAGWMYRLAVESLLGLRREGARLRIAPCLPAGWPGFKLRYRYGETIYRIEVVSDATGSAEHVIELVDDLREHIVEARVRCR
jgi:cellobiose phosphorylase